MLKAAQAEESSWSGERLNREKDGGRDEMLWSLLSAEPLSALLKTNSRRHRSSSTKCCIVICLFIPLVERKVKRFSLLYWSKLQFILTGGGGGGGFECGWSRSVELHSLFNIWVLKYRFRKFLSPNCFLSKQRLSKMLFDNVCLSKNKTWNPSTVLWHFDSPPSLFVFSPWMHLHGL